MAHSTGPGAVALVGSGEYTPAMRDTDRRLLESIRRSPARVVVIPTASGLEPGRPRWWNELGVAHFGGLGARVTPLELITQEDAHRPEIVAALEEADLCYFSGGDPEYLVETLRGTPAWEAIAGRHRAGAALAGCSAGAMMLGGYTLRVREVEAGRPPRWAAALGVAPGLAVMPHFDRLAGYVGPETFRAIVSSAPAGVTLVGVDEDTALVRDGEPGWQVLGRQMVTVFRPEGPRVYAAGERVAF